MLWGEPDETEDSKFEEEGRLFAQNPKVVVVACKSAKLLVVVREVVPGVDNSTDKVFPRCFIAKMFLEGSHLGCKPLGKMRILRTDNATMEALQ